MHKFSGFPAAILSIYMLSCAFCARADEVELLDVRGSSDEVLALVAREMATDVVTFKRSRKSDTTSSTMTPASSQKPSPQSGPLQIAVQHNSISSAAQALPNDEQALSAPAELLDGSKDHAHDHLESLKEKDKKPIPKQIIVPAGSTEKDLQRQLLVDSSAAADEREGAVKTSAEVDLSLNLTSQMQE